MSRNVVPRMRYRLAGLAMLAIAVAAQAQAPAGPASPRYTFSWPLDTEALKPRGGTTRGPAVVLDREPSPAWQALQQPGLSARERDRRAILAMAGTYRRLTTWR